MKRVTKKMLHDQIRALRAEVRSVTRAHRRDVGELLLVEREYEEIKDRLENQRDRRYRAQEKVEAVIKKYERLMARQKSQPAEMQALARERDDAVGNLELAFELLTPEGKQAYRAHQKVVPLTPRQKEAVESIHRNLAPKEKSA